MISRSCVRRILGSWPLVALLSSAFAQAGHYDPFNNFSSPTNTTSGYVSRSGTSLQVTVFADGEKNGSTVNHW